MAITIKTPGSSTAMQEIKIRARGETDIPALAKIRNMQRVRWGTLSTPFESTARLRDRFALNPQDSGISLVACIGGTVVGEAGLFRKPMARIAHAGSVGLMVHDNWQNCGIGTMLLEALVDAADNWLGLRRLELHVYTDNAPAIALYRKFGFEIEATEIGDAIRGGILIDSYIMGRLHGHLPPDRSCYPKIPELALPLPFSLRASEPDDLAGIAAIMAQLIVRHGTLRLPWEPVERNRALAEPPEASTRTIVAEANGLIVGIASLKPGQNRRAHCGDVALLAVHENWQRRGVGSSLLAALVDMADNWLSLKRLHLTVLGDNEAAIALYQRFGFVVEGVKRLDVFRAGGFADSKVMARVRAKPP